MARPRKVIDEAAIEKWASVGASVRLIAELTGIPESTIRSRFRASDAKGDREAKWKPGSPLAKGYAKDKAKLLLAINEAIKRGNTAIMIFSAKNKLGWSDTPAPEPADDLPPMLPPKQG